MLSAGRVLDILELNSVLAHWERTRHKSWEGGDKELSKFEEKKGAVETASQIITDD